MEGRYFKPKSMTWWAGAASVALGFVSLYSPDPTVSEFGRVIALLTSNGDASPAALIATGAGLIGIREAISREGKK